jgi:hypothetical protein
MGDTFSGWFIVEQMGHKRLVGFVTEQTIAGKGFLRVDVPAAEGDTNQVTQFISPDTIYCLTPTSEELARRAAKLSRVAPISLYELPAPSAGVPAPNPSPTTQGKPATMWDIDHDGWDTDDSDHDEP